MYDRYLPPDAVYDPLPLEEEETAPAAPRHEPPGQPLRPPQQPVSRQPARSDPLGGAVQEATKLLGGLFRHFSLENLDTGDILLILIVLFLFLEEDDNLDLAIALGLMLLLSLGESDDHPSA